jgi:hypothetical protein
MNQKREDEEEENLKNKKKKRWLIAAFAFLMAGGVGRYLATTT